jgi:AraC-like DNA-binding protein
MREGSISWLRLEGVLGVDVMDVRGVSRKWNHHHETYTVCIPKPSGRCPAAEWLYRQREHRMGPGGTMLMEPGEFHTNTRAAPTADFDVVLIEPERFVDLVVHARGVAGYSPALSVPQLFCPDVEAKMQQTVVCLTAGDAIEANDHLLEFVNLLCERNVFERRFRRLPCAGRDAVRRVTEIIQDRWSDPVAVSELVVELGVPASTLSHAFRKKVGIGLRQYRKRIRLEKCRRMLRARSGPIADIAAECGFLEVATFCREFKRFFGVTPTEYRRAAMRDASGQRSTTSQRRACPSSPRKRS